MVNFEKNFENLILNMDEAVQICEMLWDDNGRPVDFITHFVNPAYEKHSGLTKEDVVGKRISDVVPVEQFWFDRYSQIVREQKSEYYQDYYEGTNRWLDLHISPLGGNYFSAVFTDITERKKAEETLIESEGRYKSLFDNMGEGFVRGKMLYNENGTAYDYQFTEINQAYSKITGMPFEESLQKTIKELIPTLESQWIKNHAQVVETGIPVKWESYNEHTDKYYQIYSYRPQTGYFASIFTDITEIKKAEEALKEINENLKSLTNNIDSVLMRYNKDLKVVYLSPKSEEFTGIPVEEFIGKTNREVGMPEELCDLWENGINKVFKTCEKETLEFDIKTSDDTHTFYLQLSPEFKSDGSVKNVLGISTDITERKKIELNRQELLESEQQYMKELKTANTELIELQDSLKDTIKKLEISNKELQQFAYVASHDLQEPLRMVASFSQLLERKYKDKLDSDADDYIDFIVEGSHRMKDLIDDLLAFSRLNTQRNEFHFTDLNQIFDKVIFNLKSTIEEEDAHITKDNLPIVRCDSSQISQVLQNLISNSIKFHQTLPMIHVSAEENDHEWIIEVKDEGIGINPAHHQKIFDVFRRLHTREEYAGTGIGLSICKRIIERHNGRIWVESEPGKGANFYFTIPKTN
jgi:PAS domain S-box-containing protein